MFQGSEDNQFRHAVEQGYDHLIAEGKRLAAQGVLFEDLSRVFASEHETLFTDACCHLNAAGNLIISKHVLLAVQKHYMAK